jgi:hypothetical protein
MNAAEARLIEEGWAALVERLGVAEATRFVMLIDRRTGGALNHLHTLQSSKVFRSHGARPMPGRSSLLSHNDDHTSSA